MGLIFSPDPFHYLFLTALVHPLSTCAYLLFLSHCNNYIPPSHSRQPKLASRFILSSDWGFFLVPPFFPQPACKQACSDACAWLVAPDNPAGFRLHITGTSSPLRSDSVSVIPQIHAFACKQACSDACAWLVAPDNPAGFRLHITGTSSPLRSDSVSVIPQIHAFACKQACSDACAWAIITQKFTPRYVE